MRNRIQAGFTMVELIVVIVILGILAAVALPKFMGLEREARIAALKSMGGTMLSAAQMAHGVCMAQNCANGATHRHRRPEHRVRQRLPEQRVASTCWCRASKASRTNAAGNRMTKAGATTANCWVQYNQATIAGGIVTAPTISYQAGVMSNARPKRRSTPRCARSADLIPLQA